MGNEEFDIAAMVNKLMNDPAALEMVKKLKEGSDVGDSAQPEKTEDVKTGADDAAPVSSAGGGIPPEMLAKLPEMMSALSPLIGSGDKAGGGTSADAEKRNRLLTALKPYLSDGRRGMIDTVMSLSKITSLIDLMPKGKQ